MSRDLAGFARNSGETVFLKSKNQAWAGLCALLQRLGGAGSYFLELMNKAGLGPMIRFNGPSTTCTGVSPKLRKFLSCIDRISIFPYFSSIYLNSRHLFKNKEDSLFILYNQYVQTRPD